MMFLREGRGEKVEVRLSDREEIGRVVVQSYDELLKELNVLGYDLSTIKLTYVDEEGDRVSVRCSADFDEAVIAARGIDQQFVALNVRGNRTQRLGDAEEDEKKDNGSSNQTLELIEALQKKLEANLRDIQSISAFLDDNGVKIPPPCDVPKEEEEEEMPLGVLDDCSQPVEAEDNSPNGMESGTVTEACSRESKKIMEECVEATASIPSSTHKAAADVSQQCQALFEESCAKAAEQTAHQSRVSEAETRDVVNLVHGTTDKLLQQQKDDHDENQASLKRARELADEVQRICAALSKETSESCEAITRCVAEMVKTM